MPKTAAQMLFEYVENLFYDTNSAVLEVDLLPQELVPLGESLQYLGDAVIEMRALAHDLSGGKLDTNPLSTANVLGMELKALQATLKRLALQLEQLATASQEQLAASKQEPHLAGFGDLSYYASLMVQQLIQTCAQLAAERATNERLSEQLLQSNSLFEEITAGASQWIVVTEEHSHAWLYSNSSPQKMLAAPLAEEALITWMSTKALGCRNELLRTGSTFCHYEVDSELLGIERYFEVSLFPANWHGRDALVFIFTDNTHAQKRIGQLEQLAYYDELTGVFNRHRGMELLSGFIDEQVPFALAFIDMDDLKYINDVYGHVAGDDYILTVARILCEFDAKATVCRLGGDEFMLLAKGWNEADAANRLEGLRLRLIEYSRTMVRESLLTPEAQAASNPNLNYYSISFGVIAAGIDNSSSASYLLAQADERMYEYKKARKRERRAD